MNHRAFSLLRVKSANDEQREIAGVATSPTIDRVGDVVEPLGMKYKVPMPLLLNHDHTQPVGQAYFQRATSEGIPFRATLPRVDEPGVVRDRVDEAWHSIKHRLIGAVSVGFRVLPNGIEALENGGLRFTRTECMELSLCAIPANPDAVITGVKHIDSELRAAYGQPHASHQTKIAALDGAFYAARDCSDHVKMFSILRSQGSAAFIEEAKIEIQQARRAGKKDFGALAFCSAFAAGKMAVRLFDVSTTRAKQLEERIAALEQRKSFEYRGIWSADETYQSDDFVTHDGSMWHTDSETRARPGSPGSPWQLCVKRGRDSR